MARLCPVVLFSLLFASALSVAPEVCGAPGTVCAGEESSMLQVKAQQHGEALKWGSGEGKGKGKGKGTGYNYKGFHLGDWGDDFPLCDGDSGSGFQAPINIAVQGTNYKTMDRDSWPKFYAKDGGCEHAYFVAKGTAWQVQFYNEEDPTLDCKNLEMEWKGKRYALLQFHFHTLSEDTVDFQPTEMQMHMVHMATDGSFAVVGVFIKTDGWFKNHFLGDIFGAGFDSDRTVTLPHNQRFNPYEGVLEKSGEFWHYDGSFTTPPCTEGVDFLIAQSPVVTKGCYVTSYMKYLKGTGKGNSYGQNHRPIQPLNDRPITTGSFVFKD